MNSIPLYLITIAAVEILLRLPFINLSKKVLSDSQKALKVIALKTASDHRKEKVLMAYSGKMAGVSLKLAAMAAVLLGFVILSARALDALFSPPVSTLELLSTWKGSLLSLITSIIYVLIRTRIIRAVRK